MSRVGKQPVAIPQGVQADIKEGLITMTGPKGKLQLQFNPNVKITSQDGKLTVMPRNLDKQGKADYGTVRARLNGMVKGLTTGWKKSLELNGVGFNAKIAGQNLTIACGFSHEVQVALPKEIKATVTKNTIDLESCDKELLGTIASKIRRIQPPEPYLGKGIKYVEEKVRRKAGKTGKK